MEVLVFATDVTSAGQVGMVKEVLTPLSAIKDWNFDLEDCDNILRVVASGVAPGYIESLLLAVGLNCRELD
ncbi:hypothetical protein DJ568_11270 [Mucilaginibacter hurinus]|uniref:Uncharacterized protein n=1 Tax=Mucilaginibacter hurinus TaxID=2201324 RepID=A0A367GQQ1_9SPHI|nr:hypothetical protein [Mucilaginibacter hurinus]RCH55043.1 hypothetical protein DJ568_11270 [Mucilaginibacter hurinus]